MKKKSLDRIYLEHVITNIPHYIFWKNTKSIYLGCNKNFAVAAGFKTPKQVIGKTDYHLPWLQEHADAYQKEDKRILKSGKGIYDKEMPITTIDGKKRIILVSKVPLYDSDKKNIGILGIFTDITHRKRNEKLLQHSKKQAEAASKAKSEFLAVVSHELRIPLTGILGMAQLLNETLLSPEQQDEVSDIIQAGNYLLSIITDILDFAKIEAGKTELFLAPLDFRKLIEDTATMLASKTKEKKVELLINYAANAPCMVISDIRALRHILLNLVGNAIKFTSEGTIWIKVRCIKRTKQQACLVLSVQDSGIGIPKDQHNKIFEKFSQADASATRQYGGTGLGLAITKEYVELLGGTIKVKSQLNKGATFTCTIPFQLQSSARSLSPWDAYRSTVRVLVVDDTLHGEVLCRHIASSLCELSSGKDAFNTINAAQQRREPFDIVVINQQLNDVDAMQLSSFIQKRLKLKQPMLLLTTPKKSLPIQNSAKEAGFFECLAKPIHPTEFLIALTVAWEKWVNENKDLDKDPASKNMALSHKNSGKDFKILLVEDDPIVQKIHKKILEKTGCVVELAVTGQQALKKVLHENYKIIFMDIGLPDIKGFDVAKKIRQLKNKDKYNRVSIIGLTGYGDEENKSRCFEAGMDDVAIKPVKFDEIKRLVSVWGHK